MAKCTEEGLLASFLERETKRSVEKTGIFMLDAFIVLLSWDVRSVIHAVDTGIVVISQEMTS
jgi:hypothetical protein